MAYQLPSFSFLHVAKDAGVANITSTYTVSSSFPLAHLIDNRLSSLMKFSASQTNHTLDINRGAAGLEVCNRVIIPAGHNLSGAAYWNIRGSATGAFGGEDVLLGTYNSPGAGLLDLTITSNNYQYLRFRVVDTGTWEIPQLFITRKRTMTTAGPDPSWTERPVPMLIQRIMASREANATLAPNRTGWSLQFNHLDSTDVAILDELFAAVGVGATPFYFDPMDDGEDPMFVRISSIAPARKQDHPSPSGSSTTRYQVQFEMLEQAS